ERALRLVPCVYLVTEDGNPSVNDADPRLRPLGGFADAAAALPGLAASDRLVAVGVRVVRVLRDLGDELDSHTVAREREFRTRLEKLEASRIAEPESYIAAVVARARQETIETGHQWIAEAIAELAAAIERLGVQWTEQLDAATSLAELRAAAALVDRE